MSASTSSSLPICGVCSVPFVECECEPHDAWLYRDDEADLSTKEFLDWYREQGYGETPKLSEPVDIPWSDLIKLVGIIITVLGIDANPDEIARAILPSIRRKEG